jgi:hypothetical protein
MRLSRNVLCWLFLFNCLRYMIASAESVPNAIHREHALPLLHILFLFPSFSIAVTAVCGMAWWTLWRGERSARGCAIAASLMCILIFLRQFVVPAGLIWDRYVGSLLVGIVGLLVFLWHTKIEIAKPSWKTFSEWLHERDAPLDLSERHK